MIMCLSELFYFFWDSLGNSDVVLFWLMMFPICGYVGYRGNDLMEKYLGRGTTSVVYIIIIITMFATGIIRWC
jgi:hypothetical protein